MGKMKKHTFRNITIGLMLSCCLSGCGAVDRLSNVGSPPQMAKIENPQLKDDYQPISMPMPAPVVEKKQPNSLWASNRKNFFKDQRASNVGDILTVMIEISDKAELDNETERTRNAGEAASAPNLLGYDASLGRILPDVIDPGNLIDFANDSRHNGAGTIDREEKIEVKLAALITQILPNGNLVIDGSQEVRVNFEKRILNVQGVIRPEDISVNNTISYDQIAEARIVYGGEGQITDVQQPRYGQQVYDILFPF
ncbi:MAG: flagellar basal body L-ring protein FlgH [Rhodospirillales bacterium]|nr:flagellar basal body L-ring protein FlgH [Rhodospirillales bacterium]